jgi:predicted HAD superfamily Cof-like phosphohydrolase
MSATTNDGKKSQHQLLVESLMLRMRSDKQSVPTAPCIPNLEIRKLRASLMLEECLETIREGLGLNITVRQLSDVKHTLGDEGTSFVFEEAREPNLIQIADGLCDQRVVNDGTGSACGMALEPLELIVSANNLTKFAPGHTFNELGKLVKPPNFIGPFIELTQELRAQGADQKQLDADFEKCL